MWWILGVTSLEIPCWGLLTGTLLKTLFTPVQQWLDAATFEALGFRDQVLT